MAVESHRGTDCQADIVPGCAETAQSLTAWPDTRDAQAKLRTQLLYAAKLLAQSTQATIKIDDISRAPGALPLKLILAEALQAQDNDRFSAQEMLSVLQEFATNEDLLPDTVAKLC